MDGARGDWTGGALRRGLFGASIDEAEVRRAEIIVQRLRWLVIGSWIVLIQGAEVRLGPAEVYGVYAGAVLYGVVAHALVLRSSRIRRTAILTTLGDTITIAIMCLVTGGIESPAQPVFYLAILATTIRFGIVEAFLIASLSALQGVGLYAAVGGVRLFDLAEHVFYAYFIALIGGLLSAETRRQHGHAERERERANLMLALNREIVASSELPEMLSRMLQESLRAIAGRGACVLLREGSRDGADRAVAVGVVAPAPEVVDRVLDSELVTRAHLEGRVVLDDPRTEPALRSWRESIDAAPLVITSIRGAETLGVLVFFGRPGAASPSEREIALISAISGEMAVAIEKARLGADLGAAEGRSRELLHRLIAAEEAERRRIAEELHDRMGKRFFEFYYDVRLLEGMTIGRDAVSSEVLSRIIVSARECSGEIRTLMNDLRPSVLDDFGFLEALKEFVTSIAGRGELEMSFDVDETAPSAGAAVDLMLFRVAQEAVFNARKHAQAKRVQIEFGVIDGGRLRLVVRDDGRGFDQDARRSGHYGLLIMRERAEACGADFEVRSVPRGGTEIEVRVAIAP